MTTSVQATAVWIPGLFVLGIVLIVVVVMVALKTMRKPGRGRSRR
ncbi:MAG: hypothetical protein ACHQE5_01905 [Actinomycetes bacterium]